MRKTRFKQYRVDNKVSLGLFYSKAGATFVAPVFLDQRANSTNERDIELLEFSRNDSLLAVQRQQFTRKLCPNRNFQAPKVILYMRREKQLLSLSLLKNSKTVL